ncbi:hypothetical protein BZA70DRAFT_310803 [Myxozyma melibiosi]|uniref:PCI domain-containing protein n=1 Tax=Myxozyma melibiosi TaxID=54550 RepID=A0ABR1F539_9ASCO
MTMSLEAYLAKLNRAVKTRSGHDLALLVSKDNKDLLSAVRNFSSFSAASDISTVAHSTVKNKDWAAIASGSCLVAYLYEIERDPVLAYREQNTLTQLFNRVVEKNDNWILPVLYTITQQLRHIAVEADTILQNQSNSQNSSTEKQERKLEEAARTINRSLTVCLNDRNSPLESSRKQGIYFVLSVLFKVYFKLGVLSLAKSALRVLNSSSAAGDVPPLETYPKAHVVTFRYYVGILAFVEEDYEKAEEHLSAALNLCHRKSIRNQQRILLYLIPTHLLLRRQFPQAGVWTQFPDLARLYQPLFAAVRRGDLRAYESHLAAREATLIKRRLYLTLLKTRSAIVRPRFFEMVYRAKDRNSRMPVATFREGLHAIGIDVDDEQVECWCAVMIYQGQMKGYISREKGIVVLSNTDPFPKRR